MTDLKEAVVTDVQAMGVAAAGFALSQIVLAPPERGFLLRMRDSRARKSWPLQDEASLAGLALVGEGFEARGVHEDFARLFGPGGEVGALLPDADALVRLYDALGVPAEQRAGVPDGHAGLALMGLAHGVARRAQVLAEGDPAEAQRLRGLTADLLARVRPGVLAAATQAGEGADTTFYRALPLWVSGYLDAVAASVQGDG